MPIKSILLVQRASEGNPPAIALAICIQRGLADPTTAEEKSNGVLWQGLFKKILSLNVKA